MVGLLEWLVAPNGATHEAGLPDKL